MKTLAIKETIQPDIKFMSHSAWKKYIKHQSEKVKIKILKLTNNETSITA